MLMPTPVKSYRQWFNEFILDKTPETHPCKNCNGHAITECFHCWGIDDDCPHCDNAGKLVCSDCSGTGIDGANSATYYARLDRDILLLTRWCGQPSQTKEK